VEGKQLVFYSLDPFRGKGDRLGAIEIGLLPFRPLYMFNWRMSPDGSRLALVGSLGGEQNYKGRIKVLTLPNRTWQDVSVEAGRGDLQTIAWMADGKGFFATSWQPTASNLLYVTLAGKVKPLLQSSRRQWINTPAPSPDGKYLAFQALTWDSNVWIIENF
jgi:Tol biopolymer transport system component